jgi:protein gp37
VNPGSKGRRLDPLWVMQVRDQCAEAGVPFMFKQWDHGNRNEVDERGFPHLQDNRTHSDLAWRVSG